MEEKRRSRTRLTRVTGLFALVLGFITYTGIRREEGRMGYITSAIGSETYEIMIWKTSTCVLEACLI